MDHEAHIWLIDPHAEGDRCHNNIHFVLDERLLVLTTRVGIESRVICDRGVSVLAQILHEILCVRT